VKEAFGDPATMTRTSVAYLAPVALLPLVQGDFDEATRVSTDFARGIAASRSEYEHFPPWASAVLALTEEGELTRAADIATEYLAHRSAWKDPCPYCEASMLAAAARGARIKPQAAAEGLARAFQTDLAEGIDPAPAWAETYAFAAWTPAEARAALAKLDELGFESPPRWYQGSSMKVFLLGGRVDRVRATLESHASRCTQAFENPFLAQRERLFLGELHQHDPTPAAACAFYAKILLRWGHAKPRSVTADEARARERALGCPEP
jgi:serine/threonine-protein kinase